MVESGWNGFKPYRLLQYSSTHSWNLFSLFGQSIQSWISCELASRSVSSFSLSYSFSLVWLKIYIYTINGISLKIYILSMNSLHAWRGYQLWKHIWNLIIKNYFYYDIEFFNLMILLLWVLVFFSILIIHKIYLIHLYLNKPS